MKEQSQIDAMRAAIRGDLERSKARQAGEIAQPVAAPDPEPMQRAVLPQLEPTPEQEPTRAEEPALVEVEGAEPIDEEEPVEAPEAEQEPVEEEPVEEQPRRRRLRLLFWRR